MGTQGGGTEPEGRDRSGKPLKNSTRRCCSCGREEFRESTLKAMFQKHVQKLSTARIWPPAELGWGPAALPSAPLEVGLTLSQKKFQSPSVPRRAPQGLTPQGMIIYWEPGDTRQNSLGSPPAPSFVPKAGSMGTPG